MNTALAYLRTFAPMFSGVAVALTPTYGNRTWFVAVVAGVLALAHITPSILPSKQSGTIQ